jgi:uncharacterized RDD family membrane protein YckC
VVSAATGRTWCWRCGTEHLAWATDCAHCGGELHSSPPPAPTAPLQDDGGHELLEIDLSGMDASARDLFLLFLDGAGIRHELRGLLLSIAAVDEERTRELLETITADTLVELDPSDPADDSDWSRAVAAMMHPSSGHEPAAGAPPVQVLAGTSRRVVGAMVGQFVWLIALMVVLSTLLLVLDDLPDLVRLPVLAAPIAVDLWLTAVYGSSPGKYLLDMRVVDDHGEPPGWRAATIRALLLSGPTVLSWVPGPVGLVTAWFVPAWLLLLVVTIARDPEHQGLHDRLAGTWVVDGRRPRASAE